MYIPPQATSLKNIKQAQIRLGLQGIGGEGKTFAAATFPNPIFFNYNKGLGALIGRDDILEIPVWDIAWVKKNYNGSDNRRDFLTYWLDKEGVKLESDQTLVIDALSDIQSCHEQYEDANPTATKGGAWNKFTPWDNKNTFFSEFDGLIKALKCHIILCAHEQDVYDDGERTGKIKPLLSGQSGQKIVGFFTDWFRQRAIEKLPPDKVTDDVLSKFLMTKKEFLDWQDTFPRHTVYVWQTESDNIFSGKCSSLVNFPRYIPAHYNSFIKYGRKVTE